MQATIALLRKFKHKRVPLPELQRAAGAQHGSRIKEARELGYIIDNELERTPDGEIHSWYILRAEPGETPPLFQDTELRHCQRRSEYPA